MLHMHFAITHINYNFSCEEENFNYDADCVIDLWFTLLPLSK